MTSPKRSRPLSPHLQIYKPQISSVLSILHRMTGAFLFVGSFFLALWLYALAEGENTYNVFQEWVVSPIGLILLLGWSFALFYHLANGIRHLMWDAGYGYDLPTMRRTGWMVVVTAFILTGVSWVLGLSWAQAW